MKKGWRIKQIRNLSPNIEHKNLYATEPKKQKLKFLRRSYRPAIDKYRINQLLYPKRTMCI